MSKPRWEFRGDRIYNDLGHSELASKWTLLLERDERIEFPSIPSAFDPESLRMAAEEAEEEMVRLRAASDYDEMRYQKSMTAFRKIKAEVETAIEKKGGLSLTGLKSMIDELEKGI